MRTILGINKTMSADRESHKRFERLFRCNPAPMTLATLPEGRFCDVNDAFLAKTGYARHEVLGKTAAELGLFLKPELAEAALERLGENGRLSDVELEVRCKDGTILDGLFSSEVIPSEGSEGSPGNHGSQGNHGNQGGRGSDDLLTVMIDISDRRRAEDALRQSEEELRQVVAAMESANIALAEFNEAAESATRAKSAFLANMSHEIRTPMTAILGFAEVLLGELNAESAVPERIEEVRTIQRNGQYLLELINDILDLSKIEAGKLEVERVECSPVHMLHDVVALMRIRAEAKNLPLTLHFDGAAPETIRTDPLRFRQVLINLLGNAIKFTETGGVRLVARLVRRGDGTPLLAVDVVDTGIGLTEAQIARLFKPFCQADASTARKFGGTGLGLTISKRLCEMLGGDIAVRSVFGEGSIFRVTIETGNLSGVRLLEHPAEQLAAGRPTASETAAAAVRLDCRVLLAEDGPDNQRLIAFVLKKAGAEVVVAENGEIACREVMAAQQRGDAFDVVLMDMQMPVMDGDEATRRLRAAGYAGPILALTAQAMEGDEAKCRAAGCDGYLTKPIDRARFLGAIAQSVGQTASH